MKAEERTVEPVDIGNKIKNARAKAGLTQEQAAEALGVSRQTISNWENEKTYPDIVSVVKMSDLYGVSLDHLLKGEPPMSEYLDYLGESTNIVKSRDRLAGLILAAVCLGVWTVSLLAFWCFTSGSDAMGYSLLYLWLLLPVTIFTVSLAAGKNGCWGRLKWFAPPVFGLAYMLAQYATFQMANMLSTGILRTPEWGMFLAGALISLAGMGLGAGIRRLKARLRRCEK